MPFRSSLLRPRPDPLGSGRRSRLERTLVQVHSVVIGFFWVCTLVPLLHPGGSTLAEVLLRLVVVAAYVVTVADLLGSGEHPRQLLVLALGLAVAVQLDRWPIEGDVSAPLALSALAISAARLLRLVPFAVLLVTAGAAYTLGRAAVGAATMRGDEVLDTALLTAALTTSVAFFVNSLEDRTGTAERLDAEALEREAELHRQESQELAVTTAGRVLHDEVLTALRLVGDGDARDQERAEEVRRACRASADAVRRVVAP